MADFNFLKNLNNSDDQKINDYLLARDQDRMLSDIPKPPLVSVSTEPTSSPEPTDLDSILARKRALRLPSKQPYSEGEPGIEHPMIAPDEIIAGGLAPGIQKGLGKAIPAGFSVLKSMGQQAPRILGNEAGEVGLENLGKSRVLKALDITDPGTTYKEVAKRYFEHPNEMELAGKGIQDLTNESNIPRAIGNAAKDAEEQLGTKTVIGPNKELEDAKAIGRYMEKPNKIELLQPEGIPLNESTLGTQYHEIPHAYLKKTNPEAYNQTLNEGMFTPKKISSIVDSLDPSNPEELELIKYLNNKKLNLEDLNNKLKVPYAFKSLGKDKAIDNKLVKEATDTELFHQLEGLLTKKDPYSAIKLANANRYDHFPELSPNMELRNTMYDMVKNTNKFHPEDIQAVKSLNDPSINSLLQRKFKSLK